MTLPTLSLQPSALLENIKRSFDVYIDSRLSSAFPDRINYVGLPFEESGLPEWIEPWVVGPARPDNGYGREITSGISAQQLVYILQVNLFLRPSLNALAHRLHQMRDLVIASLLPRAGIPILHYAGDSSAVGTLVLDRVNLDQEIPLGDAVEDLRQWSYAITSRWMEEVLITP